MKRDVPHFRIGLLLTEAGIVTPPQLDSAIRAGEENGVPFLRVLVSDGFLTQQELQGVVRVQSLIWKGLLDVDRAVNALKIVHNQRLSIEQALQALGFNREGNGEVEAEPEQPQQVVEALAVAAGQAQNSVLANPYQAAQTYTTAVPPLPGQTIPPMPGAHGGYAPTPQPAPVQQAMPEQAQATQQLAPQMAPPQAPFVQMTAPPVQEFAQPQAFQPQTVPPPPQYFSEPQAVAPPQEHFVQPQPVAPPQEQFVPQQEQFDLQQEQFVQPQPVAEQYEQPDVVAPPVQAPPSNQSIVPPMPSGPAPAPVAAGEPEAPRPIPPPLPQGAEPNPMMSWFPSEETRAESQTSDHGNGDDPAPLYVQQGQTSPQPQLTTGAWSAQAPMVYELTQPADPFHETETLPGESSFETKLVEDFPQTTVRTESAGRNSLWGIQSLSRQKAAEQSRIRSCQYCAAPLELAAGKCQFCSGEAPATAAPPVVPVVEPRPVTSRVDDSRIVATTPPRDPYFMAFLSSCALPGLGQIVLGQLFKGVVLLVLALILAFAGGGYALILLCPLAGLDAFLIADKLRNGKSVGQWELF